MAFPGQEAQPQSAPSAQPLFATVAGPSLTQGELRLNKVRGPWTYAINPAILECRNGRILPRLAKAPHEAGFNGNAPGPSRGEGCLLNMSRDGWLQVDHGIAAVAFGVDRRTLTGLVSTYLDRHVGTSADGLPAVCYTDAWERPQRLGHLIHWERDDEGRDKWLESLLVLIARGGELSPIQIRLAVEPRIRLARSMADRDDPRGKRQFMDLVKHIPREHVPEDLQDIIRAAHPERPERD